MGTIGFDECKPAKSLIAVVSIFDFQLFPITLRYFDAPRLSREVSGFFGKRAVELEKHPKEPIWIRQNTPRPVQETRKVIVLLS
jgi:hypothetical protein